MPELPEVHTVEQFFRSTALQKHIHTVEVHDEKIIRNVSGAEFAQKITGNQFVNTYRQGKYCFGILESGQSVLFHLGMTGDFVFYADEEGASKYERFVFRFSDGSNLGFDCPRKFARILYLDNHLQYLQEIKLGEDALVIKWETFKQLAYGRKSTLKGFLLNQHYLAGVGNLYADEICWQTNVHPEATVGNIPEKILKEIFESMQRILGEAVERLPHYKAYPANWFWEWRKEGIKNPKGQGVITKSKIAGRTTYYSTEGQHLY